MEGASGGTCKMTTELRDRRRNPGPTARWIDHAKGTATQGDRVAREKPGPRIQILGCQLYEQTLSRRVHARTFHARGRDRLRRFGARGSGTGKGQTHPVRTSTRREAVEMIAKWTAAFGDRKSTRLNSSHLGMSYAV